MRSVSLAVLIFCLPATTTTIAQTPVGPPMLGPTGNAYQAFSSPGGITWPAASTFASNSGGYLAVITSPAENAFVFSLIGGNPTLWIPVATSTFGPWIGGQFVGGAWTWVTGEPFAYSNWDPGEPNNGCTGQFEDRIHFGNGSGVPNPNWNDFPAAGCAIITTPNSFVVEYPFVAGSGPGSCGFHLDLRTNGTSTHSAVADIPGAPGSFIGMPAGAPGNPYTAYAAPGSPVTMSISGNLLAYGPAPLGPGSCATILWSTTATMTPIFLPIIPTCQGGPIIVSVVPIGGAVIDACGIIVPGAPAGFFDPGTGRMSLSGAYPVGAPPVITFRRPSSLPGGLIALTNAVTIIAGANPAEVSQMPALLPCGGGPATDDGQALAIPTPAGFDFYGVPAGAVDVDTNGFADFVPGAASAGGCDLGGSTGDFGCAAATAQARPRIEVNHADYDFGIPLGGPYASAITTEGRPAGPFWPAALIIRWKNFVPFGFPAGWPGNLTGSMSLELMADDRIAMVEEQLQTVGTMKGIGPGVAGQGFGGPPAGGAPSTCPVPAGIAFMGFYFVPGGYFGGPGGVIHMANPIGQLAVGSSACLFTPGPAGAYALTVW